MARQDDGKDVMALWQDAVSEDEDPRRRLAEVMLQRLLKEVTDAGGLEEARQKLTEAAERIEQQLAAWLAGESASACGLLSRYRRESTTGFIPVGRLTDDKARKRYHIPPPGLPRWEG